MVPGLTCLAHLCTGCRGCWQFGRRLYRHLDSLPGRPWQGIAVCCPSSRTLLPMGTTLWSPPAPERTPEPMAPPPLFVAMCVRKRQAAGASRSGGHERTQKRSEGFCGQADDGFSGLTVIIIGPGETTTTSDPSTATLLHIRLPRQNSASTDMSRAGEKSPAWGPARACEGPL